MHTTQTSFRSLLSSCPALLLDFPLVCPSVTFLLPLPFTIQVLFTWLQSQTSQQSKARGMQTSPSGANYIFSSSLPLRRGMVKQLETKLTNNFLLPVFLLFWDPTEECEIHPSSIIICIKRATYWYSSKFPPPQFVVFYILICIYLISVNFPYFSL